MKVIAVVTLGLVLALSGCANLDQRHTPLANAAIQVATAKVIQAADTPVEQADRADKIEAIAAMLRKNLRSAESEFTTVDAVEQAVRSRIEWSRLSVEGSILVDALIATVKAELNARVEAGSLSPKARLQVATVLQWVETAASRY